MNIQLVLPCEGHDHKWDKRSKTRMAFLREHCTGTMIVSAGLSSEDYRERNEYIVDNADVLLAVYDNDRSIRSGTGMTVNYARKKGLSIILIHPDTGAVTMA